MTHIQFYIIQSDDLAERFHYALQLAMRQLALGKHLHIHTSSAKVTEEILAQLANKLSQGDDRLSINHKDEPGSDRDVLLNLADEVPHFFSSFDSTLEVICSGNNADDSTTSGSDRERNMGRERYRYYKSRGYPLIHSKIPAQLVL